MADSFSFHARGMDNAFASSGAWAPWIISICFLVAKPTCLKGRDLDTVDWVWGVSPLGRAFQLLNHRDLFLCMQ